MRPIRVLVVDDSALVRQMLREILDADPGIEVVGYAADAYVARDKIKKLAPDVLTLDVEMPRMDGISFLRHLMRLRPMPVVMVSSLTREGADVTLEALSLGAVDCVCKPRDNLSETLGDYAREITDKVKAAATARVRTAEPEPEAAAVPPPQLVLDRALDEPVELIAIGASAGGVEAIREVVERLHGALPAIAIVQHIPAEFSKAFAARLDQCTALTVHEATDRQQILPGHAYIAPGGRHLRVERAGSALRCRIDDGERVSGHRPSVDALFGSVARSVGGRSVGVLLTGMGSDGARGLAQMHAAGALTLAQDEQTSVIWGMPKEAVLLGCVDHVLPLLKIPDYLLAAGRRPDR